MEKKKLSKSVKIGIIISAVSILIVLMPSIIVGVCMFFSTLSGDIIDESQLAGLMTATAVITGLLGGLIIFPLLAAAIIYGIFTMVRFFRKNKEN